MIMNEARPIRTYGLATASPETRKRVAAIASAARSKAFALYREAKAKAVKAEAKAAKLTKK
jgi:hypothetical protein